MNPPSETTPSSPAPGSKLPIDVIFALIAIVVLITNLSVYSTKQAEKNSYEATAINLAGRQRMLSQRQAKLLYRTALAEAAGDKADMAESLNTLAAAHKIFDDTLRAFSVGGETRSTSGDYPETLTPVSDQDLRTTVAATEDLWRNYSTELLTLTETPLNQLAPETVASTVASARLANDQLLKLSNTLTTRLQKIAQARASEIRTRQLASIGAVLALIGWSSFRTFKRLAANASALEKNLREVAESNAKLEAAQEELEATASEVQKTNQTLARSNAELERTSQELNLRQEESETIFSAVNGGLCLIDRDYKIGNQVSDEMFEIFEVDELSGLSLLDLMRPLITERDIRTLESYLELQFSPATSEGQLEKFNPLEKVEITLAWDGQHFATKNLGFGFQRVFAEDDTISTVLVSVYDVTDTVRLENELKRAHDTRERQTALLFEIIEADDRELGHFLKKTEEALDDINDELQGSKATDGNRKQGRDLVESIFRKIHNIKGNASLLGLASIVENTSAVEDKLGTLRKKSSFQGDELLASLVELASLRELLSEFDELRSSTSGKFTPRTGTAAPTPDDPAGKTAGLVTDLQKLTARISEDTGKQAGLHASQLDLDGLAPEAFGHVSDLLVQLVRNSVVHGIEPPGVRKTHNKLATGSIQIISEDDPSSDNPSGAPCTLISYRDDGAGLDCDAIAARAISLDLTTPEEVGAMSDAEKSALVFEHGFSSLDESGEHAGRGAGMGLVREIVKVRLGGHLRMSYEPEEFLQFNIYVPQESLVLPS